MENTYFIRGANANNGSNAGVFTLNLNNTSANQNRNIGFRCTRESNLNYFTIKKIIVCFDEDYKYLSSIVCIYYKLSKNYIKSTFEIYFLIEYTILICILYFLYFNLKIWK